MRTRRGTSARGPLLFAAAAWLVAVLAIAGYPRLVAHGVTGGPAAGVRVVGIVAIALVPILAVTALVRRIVHR